MERRLWAVPSPKPIDRKRYVLGVDDLALALGITALTGGAAAGAGMLANQNRKGGGYDIIYPKQPSYSEPRMRLTSDFITQNLQRIMEGKFPAWYEGISPLLKKQQQQGLNQAYYGDQFQPGILNQTAAYDAARGLGRGAAASKTYGSQLQKYSQQEKAIDDYISQLGYQSQETGAYQFPQLSMQLSQDERSWGTPVGMYQQPYEQNAWDSVSNMLGSMGSSVPWLMSAMPTNATTTSGMNVNQTQDLMRSFMNPSDYTWNSPLTMTNPLNNWGMSSINNYGTGSVGNASPRATAMMNLSTPTYSQSPAQFAGDWMSGMGQTMTAPWKWANQGASQLANWWYGNQ
jgi:hypothetical protein